MNEITIVKLGGKLIQDESMLDEFLVNFSKIKSRKLFKTCSDKSFFLFFKDAKDLTPIISQY